MKKILVIDDETALVTMLVEILEMLGYEAITASESREALQIAGLQKPDLILCDLSLPGVDGFGILDQIRQNPATAGIPFVLCSGYADDSTRKRAIASGAIDVLPKPVSIAGLTGLL